MQKENYNSRDYVFESKLHKLNDFLIMQLLAMR